MQRSIDTSPPQAGASAPATPRRVVWTAGLAIGGLVAGALYLGIVRGDALMLDLSAFSKFMLCF
jgi:hypothetical protein